MIKKILLAVIFFSISSSLAESKSYILKYNLHIGEVHVYKSQINFNTNVTVKPENSSVKNAKKEEMKALINISAWTIIKCVSTAENEFICECRFFAPEAEFTINSATNTIKASMDSSGITMYNGDKVISKNRWSEFNDKNIPNLNELTRIVLRCRFSRNGQLLEIVDSDYYKSKMPNIKFEDLVGNTVFFPSYPVEIGDSWESVFRNNINGYGNLQNSLGLFETIYKYTLNDVKEINGKNCAIIELEARSLQQDNKDFTLGNSIKGGIIVELTTGKVIRSDALVNQSFNGKISGLFFEASNSATILNQYMGENIPGQIRQQEMLSKINPELLKAINEMRISMVLDDRIKIGNRFYSASENVSINGVSLKLLRFSDDRIYLKDENIGVIYKILLNFRGEVKEVKPIFSQDG